MADGHEIRFDDLLGAGGRQVRCRRGPRGVSLPPPPAAMGKDFEVEVSVDETESPTTHAQHLYATELRRLGVRWVSLAPRYVGRFEKGVDYLGDLAGSKRTSRSMPLSPAPSRRTGRTS